MLGENQFMSDASFQLVEHPEFLEFVTSGDPTESDWIDLLRLIVENVQRTGKTRVLVDATSMTALPDSMIRYRMGVRTGEAFLARVRVAVLSRPFYDDNFWETVANNRGAIARAGEDRSELVNWLMDDQPPA